MTKKAKHIPFTGRLLSRKEGFKLPELLVEFRCTHTHLFHNKYGLQAAMLASRGSIPEYLTDYQLATHPIFWKWLTERIGAPAGMVIAHWLIDTNNYSDARSFCDWASEDLTFCRAPALMQVRRWLIGETDKNNQNREKHKESLQPKSISDTRLLLWDTAKRRQPDWAAGTIKRLPFGFAKEMAVLYDISVDSARKMLSRERDRHIN